jgi:hypothetical protein
MTRLVLTALLLLGAAAPALAEPVPQDVLATTRLSCLRSAGAKPGAVIYCNCFTEQASKTMNRAQFNTMEEKIRAQTASGTPNEQLASKVPEYGKLVSACSRQADINVENSSASALSNAEAPKKEAPKK